MASYVTIADSYISSGDHGIHVAEGVVVIIADNIIDSPGSLMANTYDGVYVEQGSEVVMSGNKIIPNEFVSTRYGINIGASSSDCRVGDNDYSDITTYGTHPLNDAGTATKYPTAARAALGVPGTLSVGTGLALWPFAEAAIMIDAQATAGGAPSGGPVTVDVNKNGTTMYGTATNPAVADGNNVGTKAPTDPTIMAEDDYLSVDLDAVNGATDLTVIVRYLVA